MRRRSIKVLVLVGIAGILLGFVLRILHVPAPQVASNAGHMAADFTLADQNGQPFHLAGQRGHKVLLIFYRGYW
jgi:cytochrome oxidase Cu insertion factor (SCO1/SenC/PrrC family)